MAFFLRRFGDEADGKRSGVRFIVALLLLVTFGFSTLDVHPVIGAFLVGFALAAVPEASQLRERLDTLGYGLFIPVFLFVVGIETDLRVLAQLRPSDAIALTILVGAVGSKLVGGFVGARWAGLLAREAAMVAISSTAKLAVPLSVTYAARDMGIVDSELFSAIVLVSVATSTLVPLALVPYRRRSQGEA